MTFVLAVLLFACPSPAVRGAPVFTDSTIAVSTDSPLEGGVMKFTVTLKNTGDTAAEFAQLKLEWPLMGHLIEVSGLQQPSRDDDARTVTASVSLPPHSEQKVDVEVLAPRDSGGGALTLTVHLAHYASGAELWDHKTVTIDTRIPQTGLLVGGFRVAPAGLAVLAWLVLFAVVWGVVMLMTAKRASSGHLFGPGAGVVAVMVALGFWMMFMAMAWRDYRVLSAWQESSATILGRRMTSQSVSSSQRSSSGVNTTSEAYTPEFALRYQVDGKTMISTGYDTGSSLRFGGRVRREQEMREWVTGAVIPCWYDPADPADVVVKRGFGGAYLFALFPVPVFWIGLALIRRSFGRASE